MHIELTTHRPPKVLQQDGWEPLDFTSTVWDGVSFVSGEPEGDRLRTAYYRRTTDNALVGRVWFGPGAQGPPGHSHGGSMAAVLDEAMGICAWMNGYPCLAKSITIHFRKMLPIGTDAGLEAVIVDIDGSVVLTKARLYHPQSGKVFSEGEGIFRVLEGKALETIRNEFTKRQK